jgi:hypothetical protein
MIQSGELLFELKERCDLELPFVLTNAFKAVMAPR